MSLAIEWEGTWADNGSKIHICEHVVKGFGTRRAKVNCEIGATSDGCGITVNFRGTSNPAGLILAGAGEWEKPGIIEKLSAELLKVATGRTLYILDEPTTGLHFADIEKLLEVLQRLVDAGNTVLVIEHNLDVIKQADWIVDLGPEGGEAGGEVLATGTPEQVAEVEASATGRFLRQVLREKTPAAA